MIEHNVSILNVNDLSNSFFCLAKHDPTVGFPYDATRLTGHLYPESVNDDGLGKPDTVACESIQTARLTLAAVERLLRLVTMAHHPATNILPARRAAIAVCSWR